MHRCWDIPEIVQEICWLVGNVDFSLDYYPIESREQSPRRALVNLAKVNRRFSHAATEAPWYRFSCKFGLEPLLDSIADDLWKFEGDKPHRRRKMRRGVTHQDVLAFKKRSSRIRVLRLDMDLQPTRRSVQSLAAFLACATHVDYPLFPKLRGLWLEGAQDIPKDSSHISALLGPRLHSLHILSNIPQTCENASFLSSLTRRCPRLSKLHLVCNFSSPFAPQMVDIAESGLFLQNVTLTTGSRDVFNALSRLPCLAELSLTIAAANDFNMLKSAIEGATFPALSGLGIDCNADLSACPPIVRCLNGANLEDFTVYGCRASPREAIIGLIDLLPHHVNHTTLTTLSIRESHIGVPEHPLQDNTSSPLEDPFQFQALQAFTGLISLEIQCSSVPASARMKSLRALASAVPHLTTLSIYEGDEAAYRPKPEVKLKDLPSILRLFPALTTLGIPIDATGVGWYAQRPADGFEHYAFETLHVGTSPIHDPRNVAAYLSAVVPSLQYIFPSHKIIQEGGDLVDNHYFDSWKEVESLVEFLANLREQERNSCNVSGSDSEEGSGSDSDSE
ncbi:hypothetical protein BKA70DRAFT_1576208 [Coprinopsis sp. MPI-PUGE-AT-0042]|nr:hypothetical protein BKA70DRAFT_1576208 [Coprinopsis sp. MPI-PUGE-AT-0042]